MKLSPTNTYRQLLKEVAREIASAKRAIERRQALTYWKVGQYITAHLLNHNRRADYGKQLYKRLSKDTNSNERTFQRAVRFYNEFSIPAGRPELTWTHYRALLTVKPNFYTCKT